jgi:hypothetical protein
VKEKDKGGNERQLHFYVTLSVPPDFYCGTNTGHAKILRNLLRTLIPVCTVATVVKTTRKCFIRIVGCVSSLDF